MSTFQTISPTTGQVISTFTTHSPKQVDKKIADSHLAFRAWSKTDFSTRSALLLKVAQILKAEKVALAKIMTLEMGKRTAEGLAEIDKCALVCEYYAHNAASILSPQPVSTEAQSSYLRFDPLGIILAIMPWNFPFWQVFRAASPALMAGNSVLLKHASTVPACALAIEDIFTRAGVSAGLFQTLLITGSGTAQVIQHPLVRFVSLTGSEEAGSKVAELAGKSLKRLVLELGGSDPFIVMPDADLPSATEIAATSRLIVSGQSCIAAKRFLVHAQVAKPFTKLFQSHFESKQIGDPADLSTDIGPLASESARTHLHNQVQKSISEGATLVTGGFIPEGAGFFYPPTILSDVTPSMTVATEETFGPVAAIITVKDKEEALDIANDSHFGLGASVWTKDPASIEFFTQQLESGCVFVNSMVKSDPRLPFGGTKFSGFGRELGSYGLKEFVNIKTVWVN